MLKQSAVLNKKRNTAKIHQSGFDLFVKKTLRRQKKVLW